MPATAADATATSAEQIRRIMQPTGSSMEARQMGNIPAPMPAPKETREGWIMSHLADVLPIVGEMRGVQAGLQSAKEGHPVIGGVLAAASVIPGVNRSVREMVQPFYSRVERAIADAPFKKGTAEQWLAHLTKNSSAGEREWTGVQNFLESGGRTSSRIDPPKSLTQDQVMRAFTPIQLGQTVLEEKGRLNVASKFFSPSMRRHFIEAAADNDPHLILSNNGDAYHALMSRHPELRDNEDWAQTVLDDVLRPDWEKGTNMPKFAQYTELGGKNYQEQLITLGKKLDVGDTYVGPQGHRVEVIDVNGNNLRVRNLDTGFEASVSRHSLVRDGFNSSHFEPPNILAHLRKKERELPNGEKVLHIEELQSDWHQQGRSQGYETPDAIEQRASLAEQRDQLNEAYLAARSRGDGMEASRLAGQLDALQTQRTAPGVPNAPFKKTEEWQLLGLKHAIHDAVHGGYDRVAWTPGDLQNDRYDLSKQVGALHYEPQSGHFIAMSPNQMAVVHEGTYDPKALTSVVGKEAAEKLLATPAAPLDGKMYQTIEGDDLKVGGEGMRGFYDKMLPNNLKDYFKKIGVPAPQIEDAHFNVPSGSRTFPSFKISPELRNQVLTKGQPLWATVPFIGAGALAFGNDDPQKP